MALFKGKTETILSFSERLRSCNLGVQDLEKMGPAPGACLRIPSGGFYAIPANPVALLGQ